MIVVRDREAGNIIQKVGTFYEGRSLVKKFEQHDKEEGIFQEDFYEVAEIEEE